MTDVPIIAAKTPGLVDLEDGKRYTWCRCGRSANQPFCDGSHRGTGITPVSFTAEEIWPDGSLPLQGERQCPFL